MRIYNSKLGKPQQQWKPRSRTMEKSEKNQTRQIQKTYQITFDHSHIYSTKRNSKNYWKDMNETMK